MATSAAQPGLQQAGRSRRPGQGRCAGQAAGPPSAAPRPCWSPRSRLARAFLPGQSPGTPAVRSWDRGDGRHGERPWPRCAVL